MHRSRANALRVEPSVKKPCLAILASLQGPMRREAAAHAGSRVIQSSSWRDSSRLVAA